ncbi:apoptosis regulator Bcl-2-like isoform X1 [Carassius auratus]|uniref:Apoptosis regulator Bcl-2-like isoform X1 n=1 Tax=Carassius auratus TaxID=7957 RepID=A0A6P6JAF1_CARAU|nr:apoptosis regulator Bcl-2-like isoform X1 [Carassius auratus]
MANEIRYDNRNIVEKYLNHKLLKKGYEWKFQSSGEDTINTGVEDSSPNSDRRLQAPSAGGGNNSECLMANRVTRSDPYSRIYRAIREAGDQIERMYQREFEEMSHQMTFSANAAQRSFLAVAEELFRDGVNWGRIVAFFEFGGTMCVESLNREMASQVDNIAHWMTDYLNGPLENWIEENGGWLCLSPSTVLSVKRWISKSYSHCWKGFEYAKDAGKLKNLQDMDDFSEEQCSV